MTKPSMPRERTGEMTEMFQIKSMFNRQRQRHELWIEKYPNRPDATLRTQTGRSV